MPTGHKLLQPGIWKYMNDEDFPQGFSLEGTASKGGTESKPAKERLDLVLSATINLL